MGYKAVYPQEAINGHRAFITRRRGTRPSEEYRTPTDAEWEEFLGHFERRKVALGECGRAYGTTCQHEHYLSLVDGRCGGGGGGECVVQAGPVLAGGPGEPFVDEDPLARRSERQ